MRDEKAIRKLFSRQLTEREATELVPLAGTRRGNKVIEARGALVGAEMPESYWRDFMRGKRLSARDPLGDKRERQGPA